MFASRRGGAKDSAETTEGEAEDVASQRRSCSDYFREGSVRGSIFNLCSATLGAGALSIPSAFAGAGLVPALVMLVLVREYFARVV